MNMGILVHMPADTMREHARHAAHTRPVAARVERRWAGVASLVVMLMLLTIVFAL
jgi:hypothetical protein